jgi:hypothetical protein
VARKKEKRIRRRERREQRSEELRLREQLGLSSLATSEYSSSDEEEKEESGGGGLSPIGGSLRPLTQSCGGGKGDSAWGGRGSARRQAAYERGDACRGGAGAHHWTTGGAAAATPAAATTSAEPTRKRKRGFSTLSRRPLPHTPHL